MLTVGNPPPTSPYGPAWWSTLTVDADSSSNYFGCDSSGSRLRNCSDSRVLDHDGDSFLFDPDYATPEQTHMGYHYFGDIRRVVEELYWVKDTDQLLLRLVGLSGEEAKAALRGLTLNLVDLDGHALAVGDARALGRDIYWSFDPRRDWSAGEKIFLSLTRDGRQQAPPPLTGLKAVPQDGAVWLVWDEVDGLEVPFSKAQVRHRARSGSSWGDWTLWMDVDWKPTVAGLANGVRHQFEVRSVNAGGNSEPSGRVEATPLAKPAAPTGLVANSADRAAILHWDYGNNDDITGYQVRYRPTGADWRAWEDVPTEQGGVDFDPPEISGHTVSGMSYGLAMEFQVRARSVGGDSEPSAIASATAERPPEAPRAQSVPHNWLYIPQDADGNPLLKPGESFRLLFVTRTKTSAASTQISSYNEVVQQEALNTLMLGSFKDEFRAVVSTAAVSARENIGATPPEAATYWFDGGMVVGRYFGDLFKDEWADKTPRLAGGDVSNATRVWTGSYWDGRSAFAPYYNPVYRSYAGAERVEFGDPTSSDGRITYPRNYPGVDPLANDTELPLYGISPVFTIQEPPSP